MANWLIGSTRDTMSSWRKRLRGEVMGAETGFVIARDPDTVRAPDMAFLRKDRVPPPPPAGYFGGASDLAVKIVSPRDRASEVLVNVHNQLDAGCRVVWLTRTVTICCSRSQIYVLSVSDQPSGEDVVPGFTLPVAEIFA